MINYKEQCFIEKISLYISHKSMELTSGFEALSVDVVTVYRLRNFTNWPW
jgi:hypothetical protein